MSQPLAIVICSAALALGACSRPAADPRVELMTAEETTALLRSATDVAPVGEPVVTTTTGETDSFVTTTQVLAFRLGDGSRGRAAASCTGSCRIVGPGGFDGCNTSGCAPTRAGGCTPLVCSGNCNLSKECVAGTSVMVLAQ